MSLLKNGLKILLCAAVLVFVVFLIGRYGWKLLGFSVCESAGVETVEVTDDRVKITGLEVSEVILKTNTSESTIWSKYDDFYGKLIFAVEEDMGYTAAYVKASDLQDLTDWLENEFVPDLLVQKSERTKAEIDAIPREEIAAYYENYADYQRRS